MLKNKGKHKLKIAIIFTLAVSIILLPLIYVKAAPTSRTNHTINIKIDGNGFYGYDSPRYQVLSTTFEPLNPEWVEVPEMEEVFDFVLKDDASSYSTWENKMKNSRILYPEFKEDIDKLCFVYACYD